MAAPPSAAQAAGQAMPRLYDLLRNKFYIDDAYQWVIDRVVLVVAGVVSWYDRAVVNDTGVNGPADADAVRRLPAQVPRDRSHAQLRPRS